MAAPKKKIPPARMPVKQLSRNRSKTTLTKLVRDNINTLTKDLMAQDKQNNKMIAEYQAWKKGGKKPPTKYSDAMAQLIENMEKSDPNRWTQDRLAKTIGLSITVIRRVYASTTAKTSESLRLSDIIPLAIAFGVSPAYLLQPNKNQLTNDSLLIIEGMFKTPYEISAHDWYLWIHGISALPNWNPEYFELRMVQLDTVENMKYEQPKEILTDIETNRLIDSSYFSELAPAFSVNEWFYPSMYPEITGRSHLDDAKRELQPADGQLKALRAKITFMTFARRAIRLMSEFETEADTKKAIHWSLNNMGHALADMARNRNKPLK
jgi:transcriptional regulator with XRE-family HTH domain